MALASGYTRVEYIGSSGTQYIDTGFKPNQDTRVICRAKIPTGGNTNFLFGARQSEKSNGFYVLYSSLGYYRQGYNTQQLNFSSELNSVGVLVFDANKNTATITTDTDSDTKQGTYDTFASPVNLCLFACNNNGTLTYGSVSIYSCRIYDNGTLVRDFVPCKNANGVAGLYDLVNNVFYTNAGSGTFTAGEVVVETYQIVNATDLNSAIGATANAIRIYTGDSKKITWDSTTGFASAVSSISTGGAKVATGSFYGRNNQDMNISLGFKPTKIIIYLMSDIFFGDDDLLGAFEGEVLYAVYDGSGYNKIIVGYMGSDDEDCYDFQLSPFQIDDKYYIIPTSTGFTLRFSDGSTPLAYDHHYMYMAIG